MRTRLSINLGDARLIRLLRAAAQDRHTSVKEVIVTALEAYFAGRFETEALPRLSEGTFAEWDDPRDSEYDRL